MAKNVYRAQEVKNTFRRVYIQPPEEFAPQLAVAELDVIEEYAGPTADDLRREAELFRANWESEKEGLVQRAREEADRIVKDAERVAFQEVKSKQEQAQIIKDEAQAEAERIITDAEEQTAQILRESDRNAKDKGDEARRAGFE
ncbi:MAG: flagellar assembly protein FliH, partial [Spirochaetales bacterium]